MTPHVAFWQTKKSTKSEENQIHLLSNDQQDSSPIRITLGI